MFQNVNSDITPHAQQQVERRVKPRHMKLAVFVLATGTLLAGCGSGGGSDEPAAGCPPLSQMAAIVSKAESEFSSGSRTLADQIEGADAMQPFIEQIVTECGEPDQDQAFMLAARYGAITNALSGS